MAGIRKATIRDVAARAGVALGTVSRVLNEHPSVTPQARRSVQDAIAALGYQRDAVAGSLRNARTRMVACAIRDFDIPAFASYVKAAEEVFRRAGYTLLLASTSNEKDVELALLRGFAQRRVEGVMMTMSDEADAELAAAIAGAPMPIVLIDRELLQNVDRVMADHQAGAGLAVGHLISLGHARIGMIVGDPAAYPSRSRIAGYRHAHARRGIAVDEALIRDHALSNEIAFRETCALLAAADRPTALFVAAVDMLPGTLRAIRSSGLEVGRDIAIVAGSDSDLAELGVPPVSALSWDRAEMGRHAAEMLLERIRDPQPRAPRCVRLPVSLIVRGASAATGG
ncbi:LacI family DNA-binding transcriptional regulator [Labrys wisconsinensis]|uniref:LacI family transcriptional regulator n=1 Tax=Labrys wisconsinensis TaxID=425677 RepID=A0ABU0J9E3_9HYPH|nr:substrate-binding domain-containing protein [Labrys wisconsinensis]MDQ0470892.1 LacI family transcriptional regulator [Labrys wisconsinensis]